MPLIRAAPPSKARATYHHTLAFRVSRFLPMSQIEDHRIASHLMN
jgi:hypothetical protein